MFARATQSKLYVCKRTPFYNQPKTLFMKRLRNAAGLVFIGLNLFLITSCGETEPDVTDPADCAEPMAWLYKTPIPEPDFANFPCGYTMDGNDVSNRAFHEISWQYFLWLTEIEKGSTVPRFETMFNDASINLSETDPKSKTHILGGIQQAHSEGVLVDENGRAVYTSMMINKTYRDFVVSNKLNVPSELRKFDDKTNFPEGSMSMKASWKIIPKGQAAPKGAYTRLATIYDVVEVGGNLTTSDVYTDPAKQTTRKETVALVGFHIAVVVKDHPEFIWATFEHNDNAPNYILKNQTVGTGVPSSESKTFYKAGTKVENGNVSNLGGLKVDPVTQVISGIYIDDATTQVYRRYQYGGGNKENQDNIEALNTQIHLTTDSNEMWQSNYSEVGAVWFNTPNALVPNWSLTVDPSIETGSKTLSNSTIETFTQDPNQLNSCFSCHNTMKYNPTSGPGIDGKNVLTSHILLKNYANAVSEGAVRITIDRNK